MIRRDGSSGISPLLDILVDPDTPLAKTRRVLETLTFLAANPAIAFSICEQGGIALLLQVVADPHDGVQLEAAKALQALMMHQCAQVWVAVTWLGLLWPWSHLRGLSLVDAHVCCLHHTYAQAMCIGQSWCPVHQSTSLEAGCNSLQQPAVFEGEQA